MSTPVNLEEIADRWLRQCGACDAGLAMSCTCPQGDPRNVISNLADEVLRLRIQVATLEDQAMTTWSLPPEPGPEVRAVRDHDGDVWLRFDTGAPPGHVSMHWWYPAGGDPDEDGTDWDELVCGLGPDGRLVDATEDSAS